MAAASRGVFVNPALTEPFGLTLIEAAASGLPVVATRDGGPRDILETCRNGLLVDPTDPRGMGKTILRALESRNQWENWSKNGIEGAHERFSWRSHARSVFGETEDALRGLVALSGPRLLARGSRLPDVDRILVTDIGNTLTGDPEALEAFLEVLTAADVKMGFAVATGRPFPMAVEALNELSIPTPDILISATGTEIHYGESLTADRSWERQIDYHWFPERVRNLLSELGGLRLLTDEPPTPFRIRFRREGTHAPGLREIRRVLRGEGLRVTAILDHQTDLDVTPVRASPGLAIRFLSYKWDLPPHRFLVAGDSGNDADMLKGETLGVVVKNHTPELDPLRGQPRIHFSERAHAWGILDGIDHYDFFGSIRSPEPTAPVQEAIPA
jgi:sucrose-phosphate synthase